MNLERALYAAVAARIDGEMILTDVGGRAWQDPSDVTIRVRL